MAVDVHTRSSGPPFDPDKLVKPHSTAYVRTRLAAFVLDSLFLALQIFGVSFLIYMLLGPSVDLPASPGDPLQVNYLVIVANILLVAALCVGYFVWGWLRHGATPAQRLLRLNVIRVSDRGALSLKQAMTRWGMIGGPLWMAPALTGARPIVSTFLRIGWVVWSFVLMISTWRSSTGQGLHDRLAGTVVVKRPA